MNKKILIILILGFIITASLPIFSVTSYAQTQDYTFLTPLAGLEKVPRNQALQVYIPFVFKLLIGLAAAFTVLSIVIGGFQYISTDAFQKKSEGKNRIMNSIYGLVLVIGAWLILNTINPNLLKINLNIDSAITEQNGPTGSITQTTCTDCVTIPSQIPIKEGVGGYLSASIIDSVSGLAEGLAAQSVSWRITEAIPVTYEHESACHNDGTCFDASLISPTAVNIKRFIETARNNGLSPSYEVINEISKQTLIEELNELGVSNPPIVINTYASAPHFHVNK